MEQEQREESTRLRKALEQAESREAQLRTELDASERAVRSLDSEEQTEQRIKSAVRDALEQARVEWDEQIATRVKEAEETAIAKERQAADERMREAMEKAHEDAVNLGEQWQSYHEKSAKQAKSDLAQAVEAAREEERKAFDERIAELTAQKEKEVEERISAARTEYEDVMKKWEKETDIWRQETIGSCEQSLEMARKEVVRIREEREQHKSTASQYLSENEGLRAEVAEHAKRNKQYEQETANFAKKVERYERELADAKQKLQRQEINRSSPSKASGGSKSLQNPETPSLDEHAASQGKPQRS